MSVVASTFWNDERVEELKRRWQAGETASQICKAMGAESRSAILGRIHRLQASGEAQSRSCAWPAERVALLRRYYAAGHGRAEIAQLLGLSKSSIAAKIWQLKLTAAKPRKRAGSKSAPKPRAPQLPRPALSYIGATALSVVAVSEPEHEAIVIPISERVTIADLRANMCRWPIGDPRHEDFRFCGVKKPSTSEGPYCVFHSAIAFRPYEKKKGRAA